MTSHADFLRKIIAERDDDGPRLVFADWLEEHGGEPARAEFIRCQVKTWECLVDADECLVHRDQSCAALRRRWRKLLEAHASSWCPPLLLGLSALHLDTQWAFRRGFVAELTCTAEAWLGGKECSACNGYGERTVWGEYSLDRKKTKTIVCPRCKGTGRTPGHADALLATTPLEVVRLTSRPPASDIEWSSSWKSGERVTHLRLHGRKTWHPGIPEGAPSFDVVLRYLLKEEWPTLRFELPPDPTLVPEHLAPAVEHLVREGGSITGPPVHIYPFGEVP